MGGLAESNEERRRERCGFGLKQEREKQGSKEAELEERERKWEKEETCGPSNGNKLGPTHEFSPDLNPDWIQKQVKD